MWLLVVDLHFDDMQHPYLYNHINSIMCWKSIYCWLGLPPFIAQNQPLKLPRQCLPGSIIHGLSYQPLASLRNHENPAVKQQPHLTIRPNLWWTFFNQQPSIRSNHINHNLRAYHHSAHWCWTLAQLYPCCWPIKSPAGALQNLRCWGWQSPHHSTQVDR